MTKREHKASISVPRDMTETERQKIIAAIKGKKVSVREISTAVRESEKDIYHHLSHIQKTVNKGGRRFVVYPPECRKCGFKFTKREKLKRPGKCPLCRSESIAGPFFSIIK